MIGSNNKRYSIYTSIVRGFTGVIKDTWNGVCRYISDPSLIIEDFKRIDWKRAFNTFIIGAVTGLAIFLTGAGAPIILAGYAAAKNISGFFYDLGQFDGNLDELIKASDCKDIIEYTTKSGTYLAIDTAAGY